MELESVSKTSWLGRIRSAVAATGSETLQLSGRGLSCDQVVVISGSGEAVRSAGEGVRECVRRRMEESEAQTVCVPVPEYAIGRLIGRGGANIRSIQRESGAKVKWRSVV